MVNEPNKMAAGNQVPSSSQASCSASKPLASEFYFRQESPRLFLAVSRERRCVKSGSRHRCLKKKIMALSAARKANLEEVEELEKQLANLTLYDRPEEELQQQFENLTLDDRPKVASAGDADECYTPVAPAVQLSCRRNLFKRRMRRMSVSQSSARHRSTFGPSSPGKSAPTAVSASMSVDVKSKVRTPTIAPKVVRRSRDLVPSQKEEVHDREASTMPWLLALAGKARKRRHGEEVENLQK